MSLAPTGMETDGPGAEPVGQERVVFRSADLEAILRPGTSDFLLITFSEMGMRPNGRHWWGRAVAERHGMAALGFVAQTPNWFPEDALRAALASGPVRDFIGQYSRRVTYGFSMGGYAALRHARALGATASLALAPQWSIDPAETGRNDPRFHRFFDAVRHAAMRIEGAHLAERSYVVIDPREAADLWNADRIVERASECRVLHARGTGHRTAEALAGGAATAQALVGALEADPRKIMVSLGGRRRSWPRRAFVLARQLAQRRPDLALRIVAGREPVHKADLRLVLEGAAEGFLRAADFGRAERAARRAFSVDGTSSHAAGLLAMALAGEGRMNEALECARMSVQLAPGSPGARHRLAVLLRRLGAVDEAERVMSAKDAAANRQAG